MSPDFTKTAPGRNHQSKRKHTLQMVGLWRQTHFIKPRPKGLCMNLQTEVTKPPSSPGLASCCHTMPGGQEEQREPPCQRPGQVFHWHKGPDQWFPDTPVSHLCLQVLWGPLCHFHLSRANSENLDSNPQSSVLRTITYSLKPTQSIILRYKLRFIRYVSFAHMRI